MSKLLDRFRYFKQKGETFADGHGQVMHSNRDWEDSYRQRWQFDKIVRSTHGVNCTGSCSWKIYVKNGLVTREIQQTDYPRTRPDLPNHEPRGCPRGTSYSWYLYSANRLKYPLIRKRLIELWREALKQHSDPVLAWASIMNDPQKCLSYKQVRGRGGFIRSNWQELNQLIAAANVWTIKTYGPDRVAGFSPIPAMSMVSYAAGTRYLSLLGGTCLSFYDWYCDLPPASPMTWGEQTDVPESADWYNSSYIIAWGLNQIPAFPSGNAWTDTVALTVVISGVVSCLVFGKTGLFGKPEQGIRHCYPPQDKCWIPYHSRIPQLSVLGLGIGLMAGFLGLKFGGNGALLAFGISAFSLIFLHFNTQVPVSHHISLPAALVAVPSGSLIWAAIVGIICAILGELMSRIFLIHGDTHIDPPAMVITIMTTMINLLATIGLFTLVPLF